MLRREEGSVLAEYYLRNDQERKKPLATPFIEIPGKAKKKDSDLPNSYLQEFLGTLLRR